MVDLSKNESPYPASVRLRARIAAGLGRIHEYPERIGERAQVAAAARFGVEADRLVLTRGIDDAVDQLIWRYREKHFFVVTPGFSGFVDRLATSGLTYSSLVLDSAFRLPDTEIARLDIDSFILLASPNNPTGLRFHESELEAVFKRCHGGLVDQTYADFTTTHLPRSLDRGNVYRYRSFSKGFALAGLRIGALMGTREDIAAIAGRQHYCHLDALSSHAVICAATGDEFRENVRAIIGQRRELADLLQRSGFDVLTGDTNFVLVQSNSADELVAFLKVQGLLVKDTAQMGLPGYIRISVATRENHAKLLQAMNSFKSRGATTAIGIEPTQCRRTG
ncbi:MAG: aminotransferase class I/II-fold pyridoxal phosphate-dependent enzyme [Thiohalocapsa sp.]